MNKLSLALLATFIGAAPVLADDLTEEKRAAIHELLEMTDATHVGHIFGEAYVQHLANTLQQMNPNLDPRIFAILEEEVHAVINEELVTNSLQERMVPVYHRYLTLEETQELIQFYKSPIGRKAVEVIPKMVDEGTLVAQQWGIALVPKIEQRVMTRLQQEGVQIGY